MSCSVIRKLSCVYLYHLLVFGLAYIGFASCALWRFFCLRWITQGFSARPLVRPFSPELVLIRLVPTAVSRLVFPTLLHLVLVPRRIIIGCSRGGEAIGLVGSIL